MVPPEILNSKGRFYPYFKNCIGAIDGHIRVKVPKADVSRYRGRKGIPIMNILAVCTFNLRFTYVLSGWEGSASDSRILENALTREDKLKVFKGKFYLVDAGYPLRSKFFTPYRSTRYHLKEYSRYPLENMKELFNLRHASLRNVIERVFGVLKRDEDLLCQVDNELMQNDFDANEIRYIRDADARLGEQIRNDMAMRMWIEQWEVMEALDFLHVKDHEYLVERYIACDDDIKLSWLKMKMGSPIMSDVFEGYERQYCELSANLSRKYNSTFILPDGEEKKEKISLIKSGLDDCDVLIRKMDLEARSLQPSVKAMLLAKLREYKSDLNKLKREFKRITSGNADQASREELLEAGMADVHAVSADQRERLSMSVERLNQSGDRIKESRRTMLETEELGVSILEDLHQQRQTLLHAHTKVSSLSLSLSPLSLSLSPLEWEMGTEFDVERVFVVMSFV
ncbi:hypothetical protein GH714_030850 [Hevea brasiliensis]|uniref:DDE Tnp4 domain-containing protein n=1 Tax=Hevea brasiliensis TaxID=3981 RepID=A0A6A6LCI5_HEVBR|nr:hypothetical protein GH714_030850 [Hevea brasiliensis]